MDFVHNRQEALRKLRSFCDNNLRDYAKLRNFDFGPYQRDNVSVLSPYIQRRLILESEVLTQALGEESFSRIEKYVQEVLWRTYWKAWLEMRPQVWKYYFDELTSLKAELRSNTSLYNRYEQATKAHTGIKCFDDWVSELKMNGYLHNHTRMWFASIWVFTLDLPWQLGADFFFRNLMDADAASNTLGWRWVAGLQTPGKTYLATAANIKKFTDQRYHPETQLANTAEPLKEDPALRQTQGLEDYPFSIQRADAFWLHPEDLSPNTQIEGFDGVDKLLVVQPRIALQPMGMSQNYLEFSESVFSNQIDELLDGQKLEVIEVDNLENLGRTLKSHGISSLSYLKPFVGPWREVESSFSAAGVSLLPCRRQWDQWLFPYAKKGFFQFKKHYPEVLSRLAVM